MGTTYKATVTFECWKQHTCVNCDCIYCYRFKRSKEGEGSTEESASTAARNRIMISLADEVDAHPCPTCGLVQPDMVSAQKSQWHTPLLFLFLAGLAVLLVLNGCEVVQYSTAAILTTSLGFLVLLGQFLTAMRNPNRDREANRLRAQKNSDEGILYLREKGKEDLIAETPLQVFAALHWPVFLIFAIGVLALSSCELLREIQGWPLNPEWHPQVVGPGDHPYTYLPVSFASVKGYWVGRPNATAQNADELGLGNGRMQSYSHGNAWGDSIRAKSSEKSQNVRPWIKIDIPDQPDLAGKRLVVKLDLEVDYPALQGGNQFQVQTQSFTHTTEIQLASPQAGMLYRDAFWYGNLGGGAAIILACICLIYQAKALKKRALPTAIIPLQE